MRAFAVAVLVASFAFGPSCTSELAPFPQARIVVDTDLPVPQLASRLRVDVFDGRGTWRSTRDFALRSADDFPASFSVFLPNENAASDVVVRLRLRPDAAERDYRGERYRAAPGANDAPDAVVKVPAGDGQPRLVEGGTDRTPTSEPLPELTVDRLVRVSLRPGTQAAVRVTMRADCMGTMADVATSATCIDAERRLVPAGPGDGDDDGRPSAAGSFLSRSGAPAVEAPPHAVAIAGGAFVLGGDELGVGLPGAQIAPSYPPRAAVVTSFAIDREEVTVARMRAAVKAGFVATALQDNTGPLGTSSTDPLASCTYRATPDPADPERDALPVTCVGFATARAFCKHEGGDLPTEAQWEYAAAVSSRRQKTRYPWGNSAPDCEGVVFARFDAPSSGATGCHDRGFGFGPRGAATADQDVTVDGVRGLAGTASEWVRGVPLPFDSACYIRAGILDPTCDAPSAERAIRGGSFASTESPLAATFRGRAPNAANAPTLGFRCVYAR